MRVPPRQVRFAPGADQLSGEEPGRERRTGTTSIRRIAYLWQFYAASAAERLCGSAVADSMLNRILHQSKISVNLHDCFSLISTSQCRFKKLLMPSLLLKTESRSFLHAEQSCLHRGRIAAPTESQSKANWPRCTTCFDALVDNRNGLSRVGYSKSK